MVKRSFPRDDVGTFLISNAVVICKQNYWKSGSLAVE